MKYLNTNQIDYVLYHISYHIHDHIFPLIQSKFEYIKYESPAKKKSIIFKLSPRDLKVADVMYIGDIPILFPIDDVTKFYSIEGNNLIFHHDLLKSCFYLLSGYQEYKSQKKDHLGRFPFEESIQHTLGFIDKPIVNYYFEIILKGIEEYCVVNNIEFKRKYVFDSWKVMLTHDIDRIDTYTIYELFHRFKQLTGLASSRYSWSYTLKLFFKYIYGYLTKRRNNPHWDFDLIRRIEKKYRYNSVFYFLPKDQLHQDSYYSFDERRILKLFEKLDQDGCEIGLHGTIRSINDSCSMQKIYDNLKRNSPQKPVGIRQHRLLFNNPVTLKVQEQVGLKYDTSLGFAGHEGFRNSYCLPFKLFDFEKNETIEIWEIPLTTMDGTLFGYRNLSTEKAKESITQLIQEVKKFNGIFTFLWHNGFEIDNPDKRISNFYKTALNLFSSEGGKSILGREIIEKLNP